MLLNQLESVGDAKLRAEARLTRAVIEEHRRINSQLARSCRVVLWPKANVQQWAATKPKRMFPAWLIRPMMRLRLCWAHDNFKRTAMLNYGTRLVDFHEGYTTNTCNSCGKYQKVKINRRVRRCPKCGDMRHREVLACTNAIIACNAQAQAWLDGMK